MLLLERILAVPALVPPPDVFTNVNSDMSKLENHCAPWSAPLPGPTQGDTSSEKRAFGRLVLSAFTSSVMYCPAWAGVQGCVWLLPVYWYQSGSISKMIGLLVP